jgi:hypothetical protein
VIFRNQRAHLITTADAIPTIDRFFTHEPLQENSRRGSRCIRQARNAKAAAQSQARPR